MNIPPIIRRYVDSINSHDWAKLAGCFSAKAVVQDSTGKHQGRGAIGMWAHGLMQKGELEMWPLSLREGSAVFVLKAKMVGNFPGSPAEVDFHFQVSGNEISALRIG